MEKTIEQLVGQVNSGRCVGTEVTNSTDKDFSLPRFYCYSGHTHPPEGSDIKSGSKGHWIFVKTAGSARGSVGLLVYKIGVDLNLAILFSNPYDYNLYSIEFALALYKQDMEGTGLDVLYDHIYNEREQGSIKVVKRKLSSIQETLVLKAKGLRVSASMSNDTKAVIKVQVDLVGKEPGSEKRTDQSKSQQDRDRGENTKEQTDSVGKEPGSEKGTDPPKSQQDPDRGENAKEQTDPVGKKPGSEKGTDPPKSQQDPDRGENAKEQTDPVGKEQSSANNPPKP